MSFNINYDECYKVIKNKFLKSLYLSHKESKLLFITWFFIVYRPPAWHAYFWEFLACGLSSYIKTYIKYNLYNIEQKASYVIKLNHKLLSSKLILNWDRDSTFST